MIQEISHDSLFSRRKAKTRSSLLAQSVGTDLKPLLPPEVKAVEKETLKKKSLFDTTRSPSTSPHLHFIQFQVNPRCCHVILWCLYFFFLSFSKLWLITRFIFIDEEKPIQFLVFSVKQIRNTADKVGAQTATETQVSERPCKQNMSSSSAFSNKPLALIYRTNRRRLS